MIQQLAKEFVNKFSALFYAPSQHSEMIWIVLPLLIVIFSMTFYFSKYKEEELGWNTALGNSLILIFVSIDLFRTIFNITSPGNIQNFGIYSIATFIVFLLFLEGVLLLLVNFTHLLPKKIAYFLSSPLSVNLTAYVLICLIYSKMQINIISIISTIIFFILLLLVFLTIGFVSQKWWKRIERLKNNEKIEDVKKEKKLIVGTVKKLKEREKKIEQAEKTETKEVNKKKEELRKIKKIIHPNRSKHKKKR